jgi:hypothetical protein
VWAQALSRSHTARGGEREPHSKGRREEAGPARSLPDPGQRYVGPVGYERKRFLNLHEERNPRGDSELPDPSNTGLCGDYKAKAGCPGMISIESGKLLLQ